MSSHHATRTRQPQGTPAGGQFAAEQRPGAGIALADVTNSPSSARLEIRSELDHILSQLTESHEIDSARWNGEGKDSTYPHAEHEAAVAALRAYSEALGSDLSPTGRRAATHGGVRVPTFIDVEVNSHTPEPLPKWPAGVDAPEVSFELDNGRIETMISFDDRSLVVWTVDDEVYTSAETDDEVLDGLEDEDTVAISEWAEQVHHRLDAMAYGIQIQAVNGVDLRDEVIKQALTTETD